MNRSTVVAISLLVTACASTRPALHVIGVYEGAVGGANSDQDRWSRQMGHNEEREVRVNITDRTRPIVLVLTADEWTVWKLNLASGVRLTRIIVGGYHAQRVTGLKPGTPIEVYTYDPSPCDTCFQSSKYFTFYEAPPVDFLRELTGLEITSFQGRYHGTEFSIFKNMKRFNSEQPNNALERERGQ